MSSHILYHPVGSESALALAEALTIPASPEGPTDRVDLLIRWGSHAPVRFKPARVLNSKAALSRKSNRADALETLRNAGINVPSFFTDYHDYVEYLEYTHDHEHPKLQAGLLPEDLMIRTLYNGDRQTYRGEGITILAEGSSMSAIPRDADLYMALIPKNEQWRVHVLLGETRAHQLVPNDDLHMLLPVWNDDGPFTFVTQAAPPEVTALAGAAITTLGLNFGAVDIIRDAIDGRYFVTEVNTAPGIAGMGGTFRWYVDRISTILPR